MSTDYTGRKIDLSLFTGIGAETGQYQLAESLLPGAVCTGIAALLQRVVIELCTGLGTRPLDPTSGVSFIPRLQQGLFRSEEDAAVAFGFDAVGITERVQAQVYEGQPFDEQLESLTLEQIVLSPGEVSLTIRITSVAGESVSVILPVERSPVALV